MCLSVDLVSSSVIYVTTWILFHHRSLHQQCGISGGTLVLFHWSMNCGLNLVAGGFFFFQKSSCLRWGLYIFFKGSGTLGRVRNAEHFWLSKYTHHFQSPYRVMLFILSLTFQGPSSGQTGGMKMKATWNIKVHTRPAELKVHDNNKQAWEKMRNLKQDRLKKNK